MNDYHPSRMMVRFTPNESRALAAMAKREKRDPREQAAMLIRRGLGLDGLTVQLSPMSTAILTQIAKDGGLNDINEALELVVMGTVDDRIATALQDDQDNDTTK
jgi:hypothetical protein